MGISVKNAKYTFVHPLTLFVSIWILCFLLYAMHLSGLLVFETGEVGRMAWWIVAPFALANIIANFFYAIAPKVPAQFDSGATNNDAYLEKVERRLAWWFKCWIGLTAIEVAFSGGVPIVWLLSGSSKVYVDFGLPFVHVLASSLLSVLALAEFGLYLLYGNRRRLFIPIIRLLWAVVILNRAEVIVALIQGVVLWACLRGVKAKMLLRAGITFIVAMLLFGYVGDARTGASYFRSLADPSSDYPEWLPSGVLWVYVYITSPLGNLVNTGQVSSPANDILFPRTVSGFFPNPIRGAIYGEGIALESGGDLVNENLNVSSAYIGPLRDYGLFGVACYSVLIGVMSAYFWRRRRAIRDKLLYAIVAECLVLTIFWNFLFYTPYLGQFFWVYYLFRQKSIRFFPRATKSSEPIFPVSVPAK